MDIVERFFYKINEGSRKEFTYKKEPINTKFFPTFNFKGPEDDPVIGLQTDIHGDLTA